MRKVSRLNFVVRIERDDSGAVRGVIERVRTGTKEPFSGIDAIGALIGRMVENEPADVPRGAGRDRGAPRPDQRGGQ